MQQRVPVVIPHTRPASKIGVCESSVAYTRVHKCACQSFVERSEAWGSAYEALYVSLSPTNWRTAANIEQNEQNAAGMLFPYALLLLPQLLLSACRCVLARHARRRAYRTIR